MLKLMPRANMTSERIYYWKKMRSDFQISLAQGQEEVRKSNGRQNKWGLRRTCRRKRYRPNLKKIRGATVAHLHLQKRSGLTPDLPPATTLIWPPIRRLHFPPRHLLGKWLLDTCCAWAPMSPRSLCMLILKDNKSGRANCITQSGRVCREDIVLTGCRCAPANVAAVH